MRSADILLDARMTATQADKAAERGDSYTAVAAYEGFLARREAQSQDLVSFPVLMDIAGAHLQAASDRMDLAKTPAFQNLALWQQNRDRIDQHLRLVPPLIVAAVHQAQADEGDRADFARLRCRAITQLGYGSALLGTVDSTVPDLETAIRIYHSVETCEPGAAHAVRYLQTYRDNMIDSPLSHDRLASDVAQLVKIAPHAGDAMSAAVEIGYDYVKHDRESVRSLPH